jgi:hypothetical protein
LRRSCALAEATTEWERLTCHLTEQLLYYAQTAWAQWRDVQIMELAQSFGIPDGAIEYRFSGFHGNRGAVRVIDLDWLRTQGGFDWDSELQNALDQMGPPPEPDLITLPTHGMCGRAGALANATVANRLLRSIGPSISNSARPK